MNTLQLSKSPRLFVTPAIADHLSDRLHSTFLKSTAQNVLRDADWLTRLDPVVEGAAPAYGVGARWVQSHLDCLTCAWILTRQAKYRKAALRHLAGLMKWNHISCEARANTPPENQLPYCLSYGEQSMAIGMMYDHFRPDLTSAEQRIFFDVIDRFHLKQAVQCLTSPPWWANQAWSNWNAVCSGGMGVMALAVYHDRPDAQPLIPFVEASLAEYFKSYISNGGGCPEGTGYWNYGMNYAMRYLLSWESATGQQHTALKIKELGESLNFPVDFTGVSFGDNDGWHPTAFFFLLARRMNLPHAALRAAAYLPQEAAPAGKRQEQQYLGAVTPARKKVRGQFASNGDLLYAVDAIPTEDRIKQLRAAHARRKVPVARVYQGMEWAALADDEAFPRLRMAIRGGSAKVEGHGMVDLLGFHCRVNGQLMITDQNDTGYLTTTFGRRGTDIYPRSAEAKSTLFVEGLGAAKDAVCDKTQVVRGKGVAGIRIDATHAYLPKMPARFIGRLFLFVDNAYWLVIDHVLSNNEVVHLGIESRFHTYAKFKRVKNHVALTSGKEKMQMTFAALQPGVIQESRGMPPLPIGEQTTIFRWMGQERVADNLHVVALNPGSRRLGLAVRKRRDGSYEIDVTQPGSRGKRICVTADLNLQK